MTDRNDGPSTEEDEPTALEQFQGLQNIGRAAAEGFDEPGTVKPVFEAYDPSANLFRDPVTGAMRSKRWEEQGPQFLDYKNFLRDVVQTPQALPSPVDPAVTQDQVLEGLRAGTTALEVYGKPLAMDGDLGTSLGPEFLTQTEWWSLNSGLTLEHIDMWEAQQAMWANSQEAIHDFTNKVGVSIERARMNDAAIRFDQDYGTALGEEWIDTMMYVLDRNIDERRLSTLYSEMALTLENRPHLLKNDEGKAQFVMEFISRNAQLSQEHMLESGQIEADPPPGLMDAFMGFGGIALGIVDLLPEERLGFDVEGEITGGLTTALGAATGAPIINVGMQGLGLVMSPIDEYVVDPLRAAVSKGFAQGSFGGFTFGLDTANPYRAYLTPGQNLAISMGFDPGTDGYKNASGALDLATYFAFDPLTYIAPMAKGHSLAKIRAAAAADVGTIGARLRSVGKALIPGKFVPGAGRNMALGWTGMKGPLTRAYYFATAQTAENLAKTKGAQKFFQRIWKNVEGGRVGQLVEDLPQLEGTKLVDQFEAADSLKDIQEIWIANVNGITDGARAEGAVRGRFDKISNEIGADINARLEDGTIGALDVRGQRWGHSKYDGLVGLVDNGDGTWTKRKLTGKTGDVVHIWKDGKVRLADLNSLRAIARTNRGSARLPAGVKKILDAAEGGRRTGKDMAAIWSSMNGNSRRRVHQWLNSNGYQGIHFDDKVFLSEDGAKSLIRAEDKATGGLGAVIGPRADEWRRADEVLREMMVAPDTLDWIVDIPRPRSVGNRTLAAIGRATGLRSSRTQTAQRIRRMQARFTRAGKDFPTSVDVSNWQVGAKQLRAIGHRMGINQDDMNDWVELVRKAPRSKRFEVVAEIRKQMLERTKNWRYKEGIAGGTIIDEGEIMYNSGPNGEQIATAKSRSRDRDVSVPYTPSLMSGAVPFWSETFYDEMRRLDFARSNRSLGFKNGFIKGTKDRRANLVERYKRQLSADGLADVIADFGEQDLYNMAFAQLGDDVNGLGQISKVASKVVNVHKAFHSQFSLMALALRPVGWLTKVVILEEPIRAAMGGIPSLFTNPFRAVREMHNGHLIRRANKLAADLPQAMQATRAAFNEIVEVAFRESEDAATVIGKLVDEFGQDYLDFLPTDTLDELERIKREVAFNKTVEADSDVQQLARMSQEQFVQEFAHPTTISDEIVLPPEGLPAPTDPNTLETVADGVHAIFPDSDFAGMDEFGDIQNIEDPTFIFVKDGRMTGQLIIPVDPGTDEVLDFLLTTTKGANSRGAAMSMTLKAVEELAPILDIDVLAHLVRRGGSQGTGILLSEDGARFAHRMMQRNSVRPARRTLSYSQARYAADQLLNRYFEDLNFSLNGRVSFIKEVGKAVRNVRRAVEANQPKWAQAERYGVDDLGKVGQDLAGEGVSIYSKSLMDDVIHRNDAGRRPVTLGRGDTTTRMYSEGYVTNLVREANDAWQRYTVQRMLDNGQGQRLEDFIVRADWYQMKDNIKRIAEGSNYSGTFDDLSLATWYFEQWAPRNVIDNNLAEFWTRADGTIDEVRRIEVLEGFLDGEIKLPNGEMMPLSRQGIKSAQGAFKEYLDDGFAQGERFTYLPKSVVADQGALYGLQGGPRWLNRPNEIMSRIVDKMGPKASEAVTREPGWRQVYGDYRQHYERMGWSPERADAAARIRATRTINDLMYNIDQMANWRVRFNGIVPFGAALVEVMEVWFKNLPRDNIGGGGMAGWLVGSAALTRRVQRLSQGLEAIGLLVRDEDGELVLVADTDRETGTPLGNVLSGGLANLFSAPVHFANMMANVVPLTSDLELPVPDRYSFQFGDPIRNPLDTNNGGLFAINRFSVGLSPPLAWGANQMLHMSGLMGKKDSRRFPEGIHLQDLLEELDMELGEFMTDPDNRQTLRANGIDLDDVASDMDLFLMGTNPLLTGEFHFPNTGFWQEVFGEYIFPFGAPQSPQEAIGDYAPGAFLWLARSIENQFNPGVDLDDDERRDINSNTTPLTDWMFGPMSAYQSDGSLNHALMYDNARNGTLDEWERLQKEITQLRIDMVNDGVAVMMDTDISDTRNDRFRANASNEEAELDPRWVQIEKLKQEMADQEEIVITRAVNTSSANMFVRSMTMFLAPTSPRLQMREQLEIGEFWKSVDFAESIRKGEGQEAYNDWIRNVDPRNWTEMADVVLSFLSQDDAYGFLDPNVSAVKRDFLKNNPHLSLYLTPSKIYSERWRDTESPDAFFNGIQAGTIKYADPEVFLMRNFRQQQSWQQGAERVKFFEGAESTEKGGLYALENWNAYQDMNERHKVERDFILFMDAQEFGGAYGKALAAERKAREEEGLAPISLEAETEQIVREQRLDDLKLLNQSLDTFLDELDNYDLDPADAKEIRSVLFGLQAIQDQLIEVASDLNEFGAFSIEEAQLTSYFDVIYSPFTRQLSVLYDAAFAATDKYERSIAFDNVRAFANSVFYSNPVVNGVSYPNPLKWQLDIKSPEDMLLKAQRAIGKKVEWLHAADVEAIRRVSAKPEDVDKYLPSSMAEWTPYHIYNEYVNDVEEQRLAGLIKDSDASKLKKGAEEILEGKLIDRGLQMHVDFQRDQPAGQLRKLGMLDSVLFELHDHAQLYLEQAQFMRDAGITGIDLLWREEYWPDMDYYLSNDPIARAAFEEAISVMYGESNWRTGARKLFLGKFGTE